MSSWTSAILTNHEDWSLSTLLRPDELPAFPPSYAGDAVELGDLVDPLPPLVELKPDDSIVRPKDIDRITGSVRVSSVTTDGTTPPTVSFATGSTSTLPTSGTPTSIPMRTRA